MPKDNAELVENLPIGIANISLKDRDGTREPRRPDKHTDRVAWNAHFERAIAAKYSRSRKLNNTSLMMEDVPSILASAKAFGMPRLNQNNAQLTLEILDYEGKLIALAVEHMVYGTFKADWEKTDVEKKKEVVLEGLYRGACYAPRDNSRISCPEMTIDSLIGDGEFNLINLLKRLISHDPVGNCCVKEIYLFSHPYVEHELRHTENAPDVLKAFQYYSLLLRNWYIIATLRGTLEVFYGIPSQPCIPVVTHSAPSEERKRVSNFVREELKNRGRYVDSSQCREETPMKEYACYKCQVRTEDKTVLKRCSRCQLAWYCSAECQSKDWKDHKKYCGQNKFDPKFLTPTKEGPESFIGCPDPVPGFIRSTALLRQIWYLSKPDSQGRDYHVDVKFDRTRSVIILNPSIRFVFLVARNRAMASGSKAAVYQMFEILDHQERHGFHGVTLDQIRTQLEREYLVTIDSTSIQSERKNWVPPTAKELADEREYLTQRLARVQ